MIYFGIVVTILVFLGFTLAQIILLVPHPGESWLEMYQDPREMAVLKISVPISVASFIVDIYTFIIPIAGVSGLKLSRKRKIGVLMVFITGLWYVYKASFNDLFIYLFIYSSYVYAEIFEGETDFN